MDWSKFAQYGLEGLVICALFVVLYKIINYTMRFIDKTTEQQSNERLAWQEQQKGYVEVIKTINESIKLHNQQSIDSHESIREGQKYQREEHKEMITILGRINGYNHE